MPDPLSPLQRRHLGEDAIGIGRSSRGQLGGDSNPVLPSNGEALLRTTTTWSQLFVGWFDRRGTAGASGVTSSKSANGAGEVLEPLQELVLQPPQPSPVPAIFHQDIAEPIHQNIGGTIEESTLPEVAIAPMEVMQLYRGLENGKGEKVIASSSVGQPDSGRTLVATGNIEALRYPTSTYAQFLAGWSECHDGEDDANEDATGNVKYGGEVLLEPLEELDLLMAAQPPTSSAATNPIQQHGNQSAEAPMKPRAVTGPMKVMQLYRGFKALVNVQLPPARPSFRDLRTREQFKLLQLQTGS